MESIGALISSEGTPSFGNLEFLLRPGHQVHPGQILGVSHHRRSPELLTIIQVDDCVEINKRETPDLAVAREFFEFGPAGSVEGASTRVFRVAKCKTVSEWRINHSPFAVIEEKAPETLCRAGDPVILIDKSYEQQVIGGESSPDKGLEMGKIYGPSRTDVILSPKMLQLGTGFFGSPGFGKSYAGGVCIEEAIAWGIPVIAIDVNGEMIEAAKELGGLSITLPDKKQFGFSLSEITAQELIDISPNVQPGTQYAELIELAHETLRGEMRRNNLTTFGFDQLTEKISELGENTKVSKPSILTAKARIDQLRRDPLIGESFKFIDQVKQHRFIVLDCRFTELRQTRIIAAAAARALKEYGQRMARESRNMDSPNQQEASNWFSVLFIDEAHLVAPATENVVSTQVLRELARMGRHVRTGLILSSQSPSDLDPAILKRIQTRFVFAIERDQLRSIHGIASDFGEKTVGALPKLPRGVCAVTGNSEIVKHGFILRIRERRTPVGGSTPKVFDARKKEKQ
jgi:DNA helicase HerA-like ATPase